MSGADSPWDTGGFRLFITHLATQKADVGELKAALVEHAIEGFVAHQTIEPTQEWQNVVEAALRSCDGLAAWLTPGIRDSSWCDQEIGFAVARSILVVPIRCGVDPYGFIGKYQALTVRSDQHMPEIARSIFDLLVMHERSRDAMARALVWRFENSRSFNETRANVGYLRRIPDEAWTPTLKDRARTAQERNYEIREAWVGSKSAAEAVADLIP